jgi:hypothetical protein
MADDDQVHAVTDRVANRVDVLVETGGVVVAWQVGGHRVVPARPHLGFEQMPYQPTSAAPWIKTKVAIGRTYPSTWRRMSTSARG